MEPGDTNQAPDIGEEAEKRRIEREIRRQKRLARRKERMEKKESEKSQQKEEKITEKNEEQKGESMEEQKIENVDSSITKENNEKSGNTISMSDDEGLIPMEDDYLEESMDPNQEEVQNTEKEENNIIDEKLDQDQQNVVDEQIDNNNVEEEEEGPILISQDDSILINQEEDPSSELISQEENSIDTTEQNFQTGESEQKAEVSEVETTPKKVKIVMDMDMDLRTEIPPTEDESQVHDEKEEENHNFDPKEKIPEPNQGNEEKNVLEKDSKELEKQLNELEKNERYEKELLTRINMLEKEIKKMDTTFDLVDSHSGRGWMMKGKKKGAFFSWKWRWFRMDIKNRSFKYFTNPNDEKEIQEVKLPTFYEVKDMEEYNEKLNQNFPNSFVIITSKRVWYFVASCCNDKKRWMNLLKKGLFVDFDEDCREGWLEVGGKKLFGKWDRRYFKFNMKEKWMKCFQNDCVKEPICTVEMKGYKYDPLNGNNQCFKLHPEKIEKKSKARVWELKTTNEKEKTDWELFFKKYLQEQ